MTHYVIIMFLDSHRGREAHKQFKTFMSDTLPAQKSERASEREREREREGERERERERGKSKHIQHNYSNQRNSSRDNDYTVSVQLYAWKTMIICWQHSLPQCQNKPVTDQPTITFPLTTVHCKIANPTWPEALVQTVGLFWGVLRQKLTIRKLVCSVKWIDSWKWNSPRQPQRS